MKTKLIAGLLLAGSTLFAAPRFSIGIGFGPRAYGYGYYAAPPVVVAPVVVAPPPYAYVPPAPGVGFNWVAGYWGGVGPHRVWHAGYWRR